MSNSFGKEEFIYKSYGDFLNIKTGYFSPKYNGKYEPLLNPENDFFAVKEYLKSNNILCNDDSFVNKTVKVKKLNAKTNRTPKKPIKVIEKDEKGNIKKYTSLKTCLWSKFKSYHYKCYKDQFGDKAERKEFNKLCAKYWNDLNDIEKLNYIKNKIEINWVEVAAL